MDRTKEFFSFVDMGGQAKKDGNKESFYNTLNNGILEISEKLSKTGSFRAILGLEEDFCGLQRKTSAILDSTKIEGPGDLAMHYEGIKYILNARLLEVSRKIRKAKTRVSILDSELAPERPESFRRVNTSLVLEQENHRITADQDYEVARQRLLKIEAVQKAINENLMIQDERIDNICTTTGSTGMIYDKIAGDDSFDSGSFVRRAVFIVLLCLSFVLLFLHFFYR